MYKHILIPTDGSPTADKAVQEGLAFAREAGARVTFFTAVPEYEVPNEAALMARHVISVYEHDRRSAKRAQEILAPAARRARDAGVDCDTDSAQSNRPSAGDRRRRARPRLRRDLHGLARPHRPCQHLARQRDRGSSHALGDSDARLPLKRAGYDASQGFRGSINVAAREGLVGYRFGYSSARRAERIHHLAAVLARRGPGLE
jgi:hypothetical protein